MTRVRLQDVAEYAGVSMKTVSNVVRDAPHVSDAMRQRVQDAIDALGYKPNLMGRRLATGKTGLIGLAFHTVSLPYFAELASHVREHAATRGYQVLIEETGGTKHGEKTVLSGPETGLVDGLIFQPGTLHSRTLAAHRSGPPMVLLGEGPAPLHVDHVMIDNVQAAKEITAHLISTGRTKIGFLGHEISHLSETSLQRISGYQAALEEAGVRATPEMLVATNHISPRAAREALAQALSEGLQLDAIVCRDDLAALGALRALYLQGIDVPSDVAVTGWDNILVAKDLCPNLTTVAPDLSALAEQAVDLLFERIGGYAGVGRHVLAPYTIKYRESAPKVLQR